QPKGNLPQSPGLSQTKMTGKRQQPDPFDYPSSLAFGIIVGYALALLFAVIIAAIRRKNCCKIVGPSSDNYHLVRLERTEVEPLTSTPGREVESNTDSPTRVANIAVAQTTEPTVANADIVTVELALTGSETERETTAAAEPDEVETEDEVKRLRRLTKQLDAILDEFNADETDDRIVLELAQEIVSTAIRQAVEICHAESN
ncbi:hypothetical protein BOX15_Mlig016373g3, partial [Macrostomum lignano]